MRPVALKDLAYELQLLIGADEIVSFVEAHDFESTSDADRFGNLVNYFKDSVYLHSRNLLNANKRVPNRDWTYSLVHPL